MSIPSPTKQNQIQARIGELGLHGFIREISRQQIGLLTRSDEFVTCDPQQLGVDLSFDHVSEIVMDGSAGKIRLRLYFDLPSARQLVGRSTQSEASGVSDSLATSYFNEYVNMLAGSMRGMCERLGFAFEMGLPVPMTSKAGEFDRVNGSAPNATAWLLTNGKQVFYCEAETVLTDQRIFVAAIPALASGLKTAELLNQRDYGDVEFF